MLKAAIVFFVLGLIALVLGNGRVAGFSVEIGQALLGVFLVLSLAGLIGGWISGHGGTESF